MKNKTLITVSVVCVLLLVAGIVIANLPTVGGSFGYGMPGPAKPDSDDRLVVTNAPPQVVYRLDDHRFLTLENYIACDKSGQMYYNDTKLGIKTRLEIYNRDLWDDAGNVKLKDYYAGDDQIQMKDVENGIMAYSGRLVNKATNGTLVFPYVNLTWRGCNNNYGCYIGVLVSKDYGKTFFVSDYDRGYSSSWSRKLIIAENDHYYVGDSYISGIKKVSLKKINNEIEEDRNAKFKPEDFKNGNSDVRFHCDSNIQPSKVKFVKPPKKDGR